MTMHAYLRRTNAFDPEAILTMSIAFELACADLQVFESDERGREIIATRIINLARQGSFARPRCITASWPTTPWASSHCWLAASLFSPERRAIPAGGLQIRSLKECSGLAPARGQ